MADFFGIGNAIRGAQLVYFCASRRSGRTTAMVEALQDGDRVIVNNADQKRRLERLIKERGVKADVYVSDPREPHASMRIGTSQGRTIFDHLWLEDYYNHLHEHAAREIDKLEEHLSGYGPKHRATHRAAMEAKKFGAFNVME